MSVTSVKEEPGLNCELRTDLYKGQDVKPEFFPGPAELWPPDLACKMNDRSKAAEQQQVNTDSIMSSAESMSTKSTVCVQNLQGTDEHGVSEEKYQGTDTHLKRLGTNEMVKLGSTPEAYKDKLAIQQVDIYNVPAIAVKSEPIESTEDWCLTFTNEMVVTALGTDNILMTPNLGIDKIVKTPTQILETDEMVLTKPLRTDGMVMTNPLRTDGMVMTKPLRTDGMVMTNPLRTDGMVMTNPLQTDGMVMTNPLPTDGMVMTKPLRTDGLVMTKVLGSDEIVMTPALGTNEMVKLDSLPANTSHFDVVKQEVLKDDEITCDYKSDTLQVTIKQETEDPFPQERSEQVNTNGQLLTEHIQYSNRLSFETDEDSNCDESCSEYQETASDIDSECDEMFKAKTKYKKIKLELEPKKPKKRHICDFCNKEFRFRAGLTNHIRIHTGEKPYKCNVCSKRFSDCAVLVRHRRMHSGDKPHACDICGKKYSEKYLLKNHKKVHTGEMQYFCEFCPKQFVNSSNYRRHQKVHMHKYVCDICQKHFEKKGSLVNHIIQHMKPRPYTCKICKKGFRQSGHLNRHMMIHTGARKTYACEVCKTEFTQKVSLGRHMKRKVCSKK